MQFFWFFVAFVCRNIDTKGRKQSLDDINPDQFLKVSNYEDTVKELDIYYGIGRLMFVFSTVIVVVKEY